MAHVVIYSTAICPYCVRAKQLLAQKGVQYEEIHVDRDPLQRDTMVAKTGRQTVPQIFINDKHIGGCDDLYALDKNGQLDQLLQ